MMSRLNQSSAALPSFVELRREDTDPADLSLNRCACPEPDWATARARFAEHSCLLAVAASWRTLPPLTTLCLAVEWALGMGPRPSCAHCAMVPGHIWRARLRSMAFQHLPPPLAPLLRRHQDSGWSLTGRIARCFRLPGGLRMPGPKRTNLAHH